MFSGSMDILVIEHPSGEFRSSSFHVRFGSLQIIRPLRQTVSIFINDKKTPVEMYLSSNGDAFFAYDSLDPYMMKQSELIKDNDFQTNQVTLDEILTNKVGDNRVSKNEQIFKRRYKSFFPSSTQLKQLGLIDGFNEIKFVCENQELKSSIYLWKSDSKIIITDVDGTITRSDVLGMVLPIFGADWSHAGVTDLYRSLYKNGYKILYLTARSIGQSTMTKDYLDSLIQAKKTLPPGPMLMSPDGLFSSLKREVIQKQPYLLKIPLLTEVSDLFLEEKSKGKEGVTFVGGFGNRDTDAISYRYVGIPLDKIFIIDKKSEVIQLGKEGITSYKEINENVEKIFPKVK